MYYGKTKQQDVETILQLVSGYTLDKLASRAISGRKTFVEYQKLCKNGGKGEALKALDADFLWLRCHLYEGLNAEALRVKKSLPAWSLDYIKSILKCLVFQVVKKNEN